MPAFGAGLTWCSHLVRWGERVTPLGTTDIDLPPCNDSALDIVRALIASKQPPGRSDAGLTSAKMAEEM
jgi:3-oxoacyl-[acyl-carrier-protein] synthase-3